MPIDDLIDQGLGYIHEAPTLLDDLKSSLRSNRVPTGYRPTKHPDFVRHFPGHSQSSTSSCTGFGTMHMVTCQAMSEGVDIGDISAFAPYWDGRLYQAKRRDRMSDDGARVSHVVKAFNKSGPIPEALWPSYTLRTRERMREAVMREPSAIATARLAGKRERRKYRLELERIVASGERAVERIAHSLDKGQIVGVSIPVSKDFDKRDPDAVIRDPGGPSRGWHWVCVLDWRLWGDEIQLLIGNSWAGWGDGSKRWAATSFMGEARSIYYCSKLVRK